MAPPVTTSVNEQEAIHKVLRGYYDAFGRDSAAALAFFGEPTLIILPNDVVLLTTRADVEAFLDKLVASLKSSGYSHSKLDVLDQNVWLFDGPHRGFPVGTQFPHIASSRRNRMSHR